MSKKPALEKIIAQGRKYVLGLLDEGWQLDDFRQDDTSAVWTLYHIRNYHRGVVEVNDDFIDCVACQDGKPVCGYFGFGSWRKSENVAVI